eukprot:750041-Pyramimonas_sp.AAC.1
MSLKKLAPGPRSSLDLAKYSAPKYCDWLGAELARTCLERNPETQEALFFCPALGPRPSVGLRVRCE